MVKANRESLVRQIKKSASSIRNNLRYFESLVSSGSVEESEVSQLVSDAKKVLEKTDSVS